MEKIQNVWVNGGFDVLHIGHIHILKYAKSLGDNLIVGISSDDLIRSEKGKNRPIHTQKERKEILQSISFVDKVVVYNDPEELLKMIERNEIQKIVSAENHINEEFFNSTKMGKIEIVRFKRINEKSITSILKTFYKSEPIF